MKLKTGSKSKPSVKPELESRMRSDDISRNGRAGRWRITLTSGHSPPLPTCRAGHGHPAPRTSSAGRSDPARLVNSAIRTQALHIGQVLLLGSCWRLLPLMQCQRPAKRWLTCAPRHALNRVPVSRNGETKIFTLPQSNTAEASPRGALPEGRWSFRDRPPARRTFFSFPASRGRRDKSFKAPIR
ncbi:hypothetical protein EVAR_85291_1 [Eumeta japonica]|uniref:Uncharacterized protein n=1 Tax=Eumeta variegata TaxID=151549 RepID=A0A4C1V6X4_EUMVA|nr:hypothetical protein EVAR_85291_1 [Eumeta japonica]